MLFYTWIKAKYSLSVWFLCKLELTMFYKEDGLKDKLVCGNEIRY